MQCQRWKRRRECWRPASECINPRLYEVAPIEFELAVTFIKTHHYSGSYVADILRYGLFRANNLVGVAVFSQPVNNKTLEVFEGAPAFELGRFVLLDPEPGNAETYFLGQCFRHIRKTGYEGVVSFSDPVPRKTETGEVVHKGHLGTIYQAHNAVYVGRGTARTLQLLPDGTVFNARRIQKIRQFERGWEGAVRELEAWGAGTLTKGMDSRAWLKIWLPQITRRLPHPGNFKYLWGLTRAAKRILPHGLDYPKAA